MLQEVHGYMYMSNVISSFIENYLYARPGRTGNVPYFLSQSLVMSLIFPKISTSCNMRPI